MTVAKKDVRFTGADAKMQGKLYGAFKNVRIKYEGIVEDSISGLDKLAGEWKRHISNEQLKRAFIQRCYELFMDYSQNDVLSIAVSGAFSDFIDESILEQAALEFCEYLLTLPHKYVVRLKIPNLRFENPVYERAGDFRLTSFSATRGLLDKRPHVLVIEKDIFGFADVTLDSKVMSEGMDTMRTVLGLMLVEEQIFVNMYRLGQGGILFSVSGARAINNEYLHAICVEREHAVQLQLPLDLSILLLSMELKYSRRGENLAPSIAELVSCLSKVDRLLKNPHQHASSISSACQWLFNSWAGENDTLSFLQVCFGYEALFGETQKLRTYEPNPGITYSVSTKCAFSVAKTVIERDEIIRKFKLLYESRSKIVHGSKSKLDAEDKGLFHWGREMLAKSIQAEMERL